MPVPQKDHAAISDLILYLFTLRRFFTDFYRLLLNNQYFDLAKELPNCELVTTVVCSKY